MTLPAERASRTPRIRSREEISTGAKSACARRTCWNPSCRLARKLLLGELRRGAAVYFLNPQDQVLPCLQRRIRRFESRGGHAVQRLMRRNLLINDETRVEFR